MRIGLLDDSISTLYKSVVYGVRSTPYRVLCSNGYYLLFTISIPKKKKEKKRKGNGKCIQFAASALHVIVRLGCKGQKYLLHS